MVCTVVTITILIYVFITMVNIRRSHQIHCQHIRHGFSFHSSVEPKPRSSNHFFNLVRTTRSIGSPSKSRILTIITITFLSSPSSPSLFYPHHHHFHAGLFLSQHDGLCAGAESRKLR